MARKSPRAAQPQPSTVDAAVGKVRRSKITLSLDVDTVRRLRLLAEFRGCHPRDLVAAAVADLVAGLVVYERPQGSAPPALLASGDRLESPGESPGLKVA
jgi:hypothetical protein